MMTSRNVRQASLLVLWIAAVALWALVFFRPHTPGNAPRLPALGAQPPSVINSPAPPTPSPGPLQAGPPGNGASGPSGAGSSRAGAPPPPDAEDIAEGDVEDEPVVTTLTGATGPGAGSAPGAAPATAPLPIRLPIPGLPALPPLPALPVPTPPVLP
jgi:hypothetical protein